jgi:lipopolysaccharide transport system permease protein
MLVFTVVFGRLAGLSSGDVPYSIMVFAGLLPWQFFSTAFSGAAESLISNASMLSKIYFPRLLFPASAVTVGLVDLLISLFVLAGLMAWFRFAPDGRVIFLPLFVILVFCLSVGAGLWAAALNVKYRDLRHVIPYLLQFGLYISPIGFSRALIPQHWQFLYSLNPMVGVIDGFRWSLLDGGAQIYLPSLYASIVFTAILLATGVWYFRATERSFVDVV